MARQRNKQKLGFAVVGLGHIAQTAVLPAFENARAARLAAVVSGDEAKRKKLARAYGARAYDYDHFDECLESEDVEAVYVAEPNHRHAEFTVRAARAGAHVLCEKPMAPTEDDCRRMIDACRDSEVKLMIGYRLHFEEANLRAIDLARSGRLGDLKYFSSVFSYQARPGNIRLRVDTGGGPTWDIGVYCVNATRYLFADEPTEVSAFRVSSKDPRFTEVEEGVAVMLRFPQDRLATFVCSYNAAPQSRYLLAGTEGSLSLLNAYDYLGERRLSWTAKGGAREKVFPEVDQFGPELDYFAGCVRSGNDPEPSGEEGLEDVRIIDAIHKSASTGAPVRIEPIAPRARPGPAQISRRPPAGKKPEVHVQAPTSS